MTFGKRVGAAAHALNVDTAVAQSPAVTESAGTTGHPFRSLIALLACGAALYLQIVRAQMNEVYVIGHRNPDTDAICSALGYAEFKRRTAAATPRHKTSPNPPTYTGLMQIFPEGWRAMARPGALHGDLDVRAQQATPRRNRHRPFAHRRRPACRAPPL